MSEGIVLIRLIEVMALVSDYFPKFPFIDQNWTFHLLSGFVIEFGFFKLKIVQNLKNSKKIIEVYKITYKSFISIIFLLYRPEVNVPYF
jgi:hypothetical protein